MHGQQDARTHGECHGASVEGPLFCILQAPSYMWSFFWTWVHVGNICWLWYKFQAQYAHKKFANVCLLFCESWTKIDLIQTMEWVWCVEVGQKVPKAWILGPLVWQVIASKQVFSISWIN
jgi:hypothetical protein